MSLGKETIRKQKYKLGKTRATALKKENFKESTCFIKRKEKKEKDNEGLYQIFLLSFFIIRHEHPNLLRPHHRHQVHHHSQHKFY